jgi:CxxC motif-containing protein (DUF1111 family)
MKQHIHRTLFYIGIILAFASCEKLGPKAPAENELLDGPIEGLTFQEQSQFLKGDAAFNDQIFTVETGLGPLFVGNSCGGCHAGDGKGHPFITFTRFGQIDSTGNKFLLLGGPQLQHKAIPGYQPEQIPKGATYTNLLAPAVTGLGYLDAVSDADLIALADPLDRDGNGISGKPHWNFIPDYVTPRPNSISRNGKYITRFGKKGAAYDLLHQTAGAYNQDMGVTSEYEKIDPFSLLPQDPEVSTQDLNNVVAYLKMLKNPIPRYKDDPEVIAGKFLFQEVQCATCHTPKMTTAFSNINSLSYKDFYPYTDLLLHDMGSALDDGYTEGYAGTAEWRTPALWGLGLSKESQGGTYYLMHDGRATSIEQAILLHGGESQKSKESYLLLTQKEKTQLLLFLESL